MMMTEHLLEARLPSKILAASTFEQAPCPTCPELAPQVGARALDHTLVCRDPTLACTDNKILAESC